MDEDGFYLGELNGQKGMVPSNYLMPATVQQQQQLFPQQQPQPIIANTMDNTSQQRPKGVAFSENTKKPAPIRQSSQTSNKVGGVASATGAAGSSSGVAAKAKTATATSGASAKTLTKKASDLGSKGAASNVARKSSQAAKKVDPKVCSLN